MKKIITILLISFYFVACDKISHPDQRPPVIPHCVDTLHMVIKTNTATTYQRRILLEDFTGHTCQNCPRAAEAAEALAGTYGSKLVILANHVSNTFAGPKTDTSYKEDFRNPASTDWDNVSAGGFGMSSAGLPKGFINRVGGPQNYSAWSSLATAALAKAASAKLDMTSYYDTISHYVNVKVKTTFKSTWPNDVNIVVLFTQDSIISDQLDGTPPPTATMDPHEPGRRLNYHFDNIVISTFNGSWGELVMKGPVAVNDTLTKNFGCYLVNKCFFNKPSLPTVCVKDKYVNVVAFVYDVATKEVLQTEKMRIR